MLKLLRNISYGSVRDKRVVNLKCKCSTSRGDNFNNGELAKAYQPSLIEGKEDIHNYFTPPIKEAKPFTLILPPPNITGTLHLGHALTVTVEDALVRWYRMRGYETCWIPGLDHAGIATQVVVEKKLWKEQGKTRYDFGRDLFQNEVWKWKAEKASVIGEQLRRLGASLDFSREMFTMDRKQSSAVIAAFVQLFDQGLIYRADRLVNWSCSLQSAISDIEVERMEIPGPTNITIPGSNDPVQFGVLTKFSYKLQDSDEEIVVATTRPETMLGDVAVAVHPDDSRYASYVGRNVWHPFRKESVPVISDEFVDRQFGTGAVKITPAHDTVDFEVAKRHALPLIPIIDEHGNMTKVCGQFAGISRFQVRVAVVEELVKMNLFRGCENHAMAIPICSRSGDVVEMLVKPQWFLRCKGMAQRAVQGVREGRVKIDPPNYEKIWFEYLENIRDWCISRQLWWGHRIPAYSCHIRNESGETKINHWVAAKDEEVARCRAAQAFSVSKDEVEVKQDEDVLDTWFSAALLPFSHFGWPQKTEDLDKYYPLSVMETGHDILFFWVARMVMLATQLTAKDPFDTVFLHGVLCDAHGRKMSKSVGNVIVPEDVIDGVSLKDLERASKNSYASGVLSEKDLVKALDGQKKMFPEGIPACGVDALRFTLCSHNVKSHFINFDVAECKTNRLFCNKIWQATKFAIFWREKLSQMDNLVVVPENRLTKMDHWILSRLSDMVQRVNHSLSRASFYEATFALKNFLYYDFCNVYLESTKSALRDSGSEVAAGHLWTLLRSLDIGLRALAPFMPTLAHHLHRHLPQHPGLPTDLSFPQHLPWRDRPLEEAIDVVNESILVIRRLKKTFNITSRAQTEVKILSESSLFNDYAQVIKDLAGCHQVITISTKDSTVNERASGLIGTQGVVYLIVPEGAGDAIKLDEEKLEKKRNKLEKSLERLKKMTSSQYYQVKASSKKQTLHAEKIASLEEELTRIDFLRKLGKR